jgi:hypothetical protein
MVSIHDAKKAMLCSVIQNNDPTAGCPAPPSNAIPNQSPINAV